MSKVVARRSGLLSFRVQLPLLVGAMVSLLVFTPARAERLPLPPELQEKVNDAVDFGVIFLKKNQFPDGSWAPPGGGNRVGYAALPALTLLEIGRAHV